MRCQGLIEYNGQLINRCSVIPFLMEQPPWVGVLLYGVFTVLFVLLSFKILKSAYLTYKNKRKDFDSKRRRFFVLTIVLGVALWYFIYICLVNFFFFISLF
jgi:RsiW-degrading membrane proteinase PrsW (M82 family)